MVDNVFFRNMCSCGYNFSEHWKKFLISPPVNTKYVLSESHREIFLSLKYISHLAAEMSGQTFPYSPDILSSYDINMVLLQHQQTCLALNVGECFVDTVRRIVKPDQKSDDNDDDMNHLEISFNPSHYNIQRHDAFFPKRHIHLKKLHSIVAIAWFTLEVRQTEDATWIHRLLSLTQEPHNHTWWDRKTQVNDTLVLRLLTKSDSGQLRGLLKAIRKVDSWFKKADGCRGPFTLKWHHKDDSTKASLTLKYH
ncbi:unnamed protein product [Owenia fusiformis]|uniref:Uncharacterized protein n=1 Tax=Owenia fusiformis TaxID=6347 RepID=A0A8S4NU96_OWEFU|nr:unnamed protein product [Owenia fusiformis]